MSTLEVKLEEIERKVKKLVEQNLQFKEICEDLLIVRRRLEKENVGLRQQLAGQVDEVTELANKTQKLELTYKEDTEGIKKRIDQYIQDIDTSIEWLEQL
jgi:Mg2+ and Co2+ transporter CorA